MVAPVITMARLLKSAGMGRITKLGKVIAQQGDDVIREATFANGRVGTYRVSNFMGTKTQSVWDGTRSVTFDTTKGNQALCDVYSKAKGGYVELFPRTHTWQIRESINGSQDAMKQLATGGVKVTPINVKTKIVNGKVQNKVANTQEIHTSTVYESNKGFGTIRERQDLLIGADGKSYPIYQNPNHYIPARNASFGKDLSRKPIYGNSEGFKAQYTGQTPINILNKDLNAGFKAEVNPLWSKLDEMFWRLA